MSRDFREQVEPHVLSTDYYQRGNFTMAVVETEWWSWDGERTILDGVGFAKYHAGDVLPYSRELGRRIARGWALKDAWEQWCKHGELPRCRCCVEPAAESRRLDALIDRIRREG